MIAPLLGLGIAAASSAPTLAASSRASAVSPEHIQIAQLSIRSRIVIRVQSDVPIEPVETVEKKGPKCVPLAAVAGAAVSSADTVDFILRGGQRVRARFSSRCPALDFYSGFYIVPNPDGQVCVDRDVIRSRAGGECPIDRMRTLVMRPRRK